VWQVLKVIQKIWPFSLGLVLGLYFITLNITGKDFTCFPGDLGDARFNTYILENAHKFFTGQNKSLWNAPFMYPEHNVITYSDNLVGSAPFYSIFRLIGYDRETSFQWWFLIMTVLSYSCCYFFLNWCFKNKYAAVLGAMVFAFSMALQSQITHAQTFPRFAVPLALWMGVLFMERQKPVHFFAALFFVVYQLYCGIYLGFMLSVPIALLLIFSIISKRKIFYQKIKNYKWSGMIAASIIINILIVLPLMLPYLHRAKQVGLNNYENIILNIPTIKSYFFSQPGSIFWGFFDHTCSSYPSSWDHQIFSGGIATLCIIISGVIIVSRIFSKKYFHKFVIDGSLIVLFFTGLVTFLFFIHFNHFSFYKFLFHMPGFGSMRAIQRIINVELIFFAIATAFVFSKIFQNKWKFSIIIFILFCIVMIADNYYKEGNSYRTNKVISQSRVNLLIKKMNNLKPGSIVSYEPEKIETGPIEYQIDAMLASQSLNLFSINGYSATSPDGYGNYWNAMNKNSREEWFRKKCFSPDTVYVIH
jgi:hypothetical protein